MKPPEELLERLWEKVDIRGKNDCWLWTGYTKSHGYGWVKHNGSGYLAHRVAWSSRSGRMPDFSHGEIICHACDTPLCCNPNHLWVGTHADNTRDMMNKGRNKKLWALTDEQVKEVRRRKRLGFKTGTIAREFGVSPTTILKSLQRR